MHSPKHMLEHTIFIDEIDFQSTKGKHINRRTAKYISSLRLHTSAYRELFEYVRPALEPLCVLDVEGSQMLHIPGAKQQ